jgi:hypothetical protein
MSTINSKNVQVGTSGVANQNFTLYQPDTPDGTVRLGVGNSGVTTSDVVTVTNAGNMTVSGAVAGGNLSYTGTLTGSTGVVNIGSGQFYKDASGNVGVGTTSPGAKLHVNGASLLGSSTFYVGDDGGSLGAFLNQSAATPIRFLTSGTERARIDSSGNLLVGKTSQGFNTRGVEVRPPAAVNMFQVTGDNDICRFMVAQGTTGTKGVLLFYHNSDSNLVGTITTNGSSTSYNTSSDYRLKHDIQPMTGALAKVQQLKPVTYKWNIDDSESQGFIAHELQEVVPECVTGEKDAVDADGNPVYQGIDTSFLVATLTAAIQELKAELDALKAQVAGAQA